MLKYCQLELIKGEKRGSHREKSDPRGNGMGG
jgi:hypothetical protein